MSVEEPPGPDRRPVVGNTLQLARAPFDSRTYWARTYGDVVRLSIAGNRTYMLSHPDYVQQVLVDDADSFLKGDELRSRLSSLLGDGLLLSEGDLWRRQRQLIQPLFYRERLSTYTEMMTVYADRLADEWAAGERRDARADMMGVTLRILAKALLDVDIREEAAVVSDAAEIIVEQFDLSRWSTYLPEWVPTPTNLRYRRAIAELEALIDGMIAERRRDPDPPDDLMTRLMHAETDEGESMSDTLLRDELMTFLLAGHETTALALTYTWYLLGTNPACQRRLHDELDEVLDGATPTMADLPALTYTERVVTEAMRLYPPVHTLLREPVEPVDIGGYTVPEGALVSLPQWVVHRDARWYDDPSSFDPDRWCENRASERPEYAYFPFGGGSRRCIGMQFAIVESQLILSTIARRYRVEAVEDDLDVSASITTRPADTVELVVHER